VTYESVNAELVKFSFPKVTEGFKEKERRVFPPLFGI